MTITLLLKGFASKGLDIEGAWKEGIKTIDHFLFFLFFWPGHLFARICCHKRLKLCFARSACTSNPKGTAILSKNFSHKATVFHAQCRERNSACAKFTLPFSPSLICFTGKEAIQDMTRTMKITVKMKKLIKNLQVVFKLVSLHFFFYECAALSQKYRP